MLPAGSDPTRYCDADPSANGNRTQPQVQSKATPCPETEKLCFVTMGKLVAAAAIERLTKRYPPLVTIEFLALSTVVRINQCVAGLYRRIDRTGAKHRGDCTSDESGGNPHRQHLAALALWK